MSGISISIDGRDFDRALKALAPVLTFAPSELMSTIGALGESQTRRRILEEKTAPDGTPWPENRAGTSILLESGEHLLGSIAWTASNDEAEWGASWEFAHVHQQGATIEAKNAKFLTFMVGGKFARKEKVEIPARPFLGLSPDNIHEILETVTDHFGALQ